MSTLLERLKRRKDVRLAVATVTGFKDAHFTAGGVDYFVIRRTLRSAVLRRLRYPGGDRSSRRQIERYASVVRQWNPDVIHVHGTEMDYGLIKARRLTEKPVVVSIQGLMTPCKRKAFGDLLPQEVRGSVRHRLTGFNSESLYRWKVYRQRIAVEEQILQSADLVLGRTEWDYAWAWALHPNVKYSHVDELMRPEFLDAEPWRLESCRRHQVVCISQDYALKGLHVLLEAIWRLRQVYPDIALRVAANGFVGRPKSGYVRFVRDLINRWALQDIVYFLGWRDAGGLAAELRAAHCYVSPSFLENSSNALQEAMLVGVPVVATASGGTPTIVDVGRTGLTCPPGDAALLALQIHRLFRHDGLAKQIGMQARTVARQRQDPDRVETQLMAAYHDAMTAAADLRPTLALDA